MAANGFFLVCNEDSIADPLSYTPTGAGATAGDTFAGGAVVVVLIILSVRASLRSRSPTTKSRMHVTALRADMQSCKTNHAHTRTAPAVRHTQAGKSCVAGEATQVTLELERRTIVMKKEQ